MRTLSGSINTAIVYTVERSDAQIDRYAESQIINLCSLEAMAGSRIRIMPDVHAGVVCPIGFTSTVAQNIMPVMIGTDAGCGVTTVKITRGRADWRKLDTVIREQIPAGAQVRSRRSGFAGELNFDELVCRKHIRTQKAELALGTLGGGNHFIEVETEGDDLYLTVHSGSRSAGRELFEHYMAAGRKELAAGGIEIPYELTWISGALKDDFLHDLALVCAYARQNREIILQEIMKGMKWKGERFISCIHNYVDDRAETVSLCGAPVVRKGAVSAQNGETVIIPINMRDGVIIGTGLGNTDWNCSAPHGAGRLLKRSDTAGRISMDSYRREMNGIYCSCISRETLDESPEVYRGVEEISAAVAGNVKVEKILRPVYCFKAGASD